MISNRPSIYVYVNNPNPKILREICSGIEEEGVFFEVISRASTDLATLTYEAANHSMLGSGIGILSDTVAFQIKGLNLGNYVFYYQNPSFEESRILGSNSARALKKLPFRESKIDQ